MNFILLLFIGIMAGFLIFSFLQYWSNYRLRKEAHVNNSAQREKKPVSFLFSFSPDNVYKEIKRYKPTYSKKLYARSFLKGLLIGTFLMYVLYRSVPLSLLMAALMGFSFPYLDLAKERFKYESKVKDQISHYFKLFSSYMNSNGFNISKSLEHCVERVEDPIRSDLEKVLFDLKHGTAPEQAFDNFNERYPFHGVELFHYKAILISRQGEDEYGSLKDVSNRFADKKYWRKELQISSKKHLRERKFVILLSLLIYLTLMFFTSIYYMDFVGSIVGKATITLCLIWIALTLFSQKKWLDIDPTELVSHRKK